MNPDIRLRPERAEDREFLFTLYSSTREEELQRVPWTDQQKEEFLRMQFHLQTSHYHTHYPEATFDLILNDEQPIGRLYVHKGTQQIHIIDIALLPSHRGAGLGGRLMKKVMEEGSAAGKPVQIHVEWENPALRLYARLGFKILESRGIYHLMEWRPGAESGSQHAALV
jgi:ribosomal protein S18 acetylase RimI-like enzyme